MGSWTLAFWRKESVFGSIERIVIWGLSKLRVEKKDESLVRDFDGDANQLGEWVGG